MNTHHRHIARMEFYGIHAEYLTTIEPFEGMASAQEYARLAYHEMRLAGISPFDNNLNLNIDGRAA